MAKRFYPCSIRQLPAKERHAAAKFAVSLNPVNAPPPGAMAQLGMAPDKFAIAVMTSKYFGPGGVDLTVGFMESTSAALADKILAHMNAWSAFCNARFTMGTGAASRAQVRISRGQGGYWSYLGTDVLRIPSNQPTMNLQGFTVNTPESEYRRVVRHETGHTLGCPHEHMRQELVDRLDVNKTVAYFRQSQGWDAGEVQQQVLTPISEASLLGATPHAEQDSIMCYTLPASITTDGKPIVGGADITPMDGLAMGKLYPRADVPQPPSMEKTTITIELSGKTARVVNVA